MIHAHAIVDPAARIGAGVHIGAFSIIGPDVEIGDHCWIGPHVVISGPTRIGRENRIYQFNSIGEAPQHLGFKGEQTRLEIGDRNTIREYCTLNRGSAAGDGVTRLGNDNFMMAYCHLAHDCKIGNNITFANATSLAGHVTVDDYAVLGGFTLSHQFCRIGAYCMTALGSVVFKDIPPYVMVSGNPAAPHGLNLRGLKRRQFSEQQILNIRRAYRVLYKSGLLLEEAIAQLTALSSEHSEIGRFVEFVRSSERGIAR